MFSSGGGSGDGRAQSDLIDSAGERRRSCLMRAGGLVVVVLTPHSWGYE